MITCAWIMDYFMEEWMSGDIKAPPDVDIDKREGSNGLFGLRLEMPHFVTPVYLHVIMFVLCVWK